MKKLESIFSKKSYLPHTNHAPRRKVCFGQSERTGHHTKADKSHTISPIENPAFVPASHSFVHSYSWGSVTKISFRTSCDTTNNKNILLRDGAPCTRIYNCDIVKKE